MNKKTRFRALNLQDPVSKIHLLDLSVSSRLRSVNERGGGQVADYSYFSDLNYNPEIGRMLICSVLIITLMFR